MPSDADQLARLQSMIREQRSLVRLVSEPDADAIRWAIERLAELEGALEPFAKFGRYIQAHSRRGLDNLLYSWDGSESSAVVRQTDLIRAAAVLTPAATAKEEEAQP